MKFQIINTDPQLLNAFWIRVDIYRFAISKSRGMLIRLKNLGDEAIDERKKE
ncbi:MAG TPA: hypothetical protein VF144_19855 [Chitinophagaceae bacterium]